MGDRATSIKFHNQGVTAAGDKSSTVNLSQAWNLFNSAAVADPTYATAWYQVGNNASDMNFFHAAIAAYRRALQCDNPPEDKAKILCNLGWRLFTVGRVKEAHTVLMESLELDDKWAHTWINLAQVHGILNQPATALDCARKGFELDPHDPTNEVSLAFALLFNRNLVEGFKHFEIRFKWKLHSFLQYPYPKWTGEADQTVFLVADQGLGDTISFSRFVPAAAKRAKYMHLYVQPELLRLFQHAFIGIPNINFLPFGQVMPQADAWSTFVSLPFALGLSDDEIRNAPNIEVPKFSLPTSWMMPDQRLHVGIAWAGSKLNDINNHRSIPLEHFLELNSVPGVQLYSLQVGDHSEDANNIGAAAVVRNLVPYIRDVVDTMTLMRDLDLIITCESALGHIASMVNKECWMPYSYLGRDYRVGHDGTDRLWTPHHRIFCQGEDLRWEPVFRQIAAALRDKIGNLKSR
jgi:tetratricopeptide (TPR) repeat protein